MNLFFKKIKHPLCCLAFVLLYLGSGPAVPAQAAEPALTVQVRWQDADYTAAYFTMEDLSALPQSQFTYSTLDAGNAPMLFLAEGVLITDLCAALQIAPADVQRLSFAASDGWNRTYPAESHLNQTRYYFPAIVSGYDTAAEEPPAFLLGAQEGKTAVPALLAFKSFEGRFAENPSPVQLSPANGLRFCFGQVEITEAVMPQYGKHINELVLVLKSGATYTPPAVPLGSATATIAAEETTPAFTPENDETDQDGLIAPALTITVGYFGGPYYTKKVYLPEDLQQMRIQQLAYTYIDSMPAVVLDSATGVLLEDLLQDAGIDANSVESFHFYCSDVTHSWYTTLPKPFLLDTPRYYYPKLPQLWDYDKGEALPGADSEAVAVPTMIAFTDNWKRFATQADFTVQTESARFRLLFGQTDTVAIHAPRSARWIHTIEVMLGGTPPQGITLDDSALQLEVGSRHQITANLEIADETTDKRVNWSSSDPGIVEVDAEGNIRVLAEGSATITATTQVGGLSASLVVNGPEAQEAEEPPEALPLTTPQDRPSATAAALEAEPQAPETPPLYEITEAGTLDSPVTGSDNLAGVQSWRVYEMAETAVELPEIATENPALSLTMGGLATLFACGGLGRLIIYRREV